MMKRPLILLAGLALVLAACGEGTDVIVSGEGESVGITVSGEGRVAGTPDTLTLTIGINLERDTVSQATEDAARLATDLLDALEAEGIEEADIQTANYSIYPNYDYRDETRRLLGYRVTNEVRVKIRALDRAGEIIDRAGSQGGNEVVVQGLGFSLEDNDLLVVSAREAAWQDARGKAEQLARLAGVTLGAPTSISESFSAPVPIQRLAYAEDAAMGVSTPIQAGELDVSVTIQVTFGLG
ncbi:MAG: SIMPL domain-containing protein [Acidimicrobiia bacterium]|nr:SIMPL domain-containing protein [Acidimicrobiia bacterium]NNF89532.1 SIMPL domain-containing protein [Acidimicrobiia bacterium]NNL14975.1 SIMPL domain-containing protein [Acidimicrobiia bacterium]